MKGVGVQFREGLDSKGHIAIELSQYDERSLLFGDSYPQLF